uniref:Sushi domain-containing protein n=1 Tax=Plectus sambesii TaxID=2011161 RepID=A0A914W707_9BILA
MDSLSGLFFILSVINCAQSSFMCPSSTLPSLGILRGVSVYKNNDIYRLSIDTLPSSNFSVISSGRGKLATSDSVQCPLTSCMFELATNQRNTDNIILHQNNFLNGIAPAGYNKLSVSTPMYCVQVMGDCGADVPIYRYTRPIGTTGSSYYAYSLDSSAEYAGFTREALPICFAWSTSPSYSNCGDGINPARLSTLSTYVNSLTGPNRDHFTTAASPATINNSTLTGYTKSTDLGLIATGQSLASDTLRCSCLIKVIQMLDYQSGFGGTNGAPGLFGRIDHKLIRENSETNGLGEQYVATGEVLYCVFERGTCGATVPINKWYNPFDIDTLYTLPGDPAPSLARSDGTLCYIWPSNYTLPQICQPAPTVTNGFVTYAQAGSSPSFLQGTVATLTCTSGYSLNGESTLTCGAGVWFPTTFGTCIEGTITYRWQ